MLMEQVPIEKLVNVRDDYFTLCSQFSGKLRPYIWVEMGVKLNCEICVLHLKSTRTYSPAVGLTGGY